MLANPTFDADLLARYDRPGPRYTSYPTAPQFADGFGEEQLRAAVLASNGDPIPRRLSLYVHVPFSRSRPSLTIAWARGWSLNASTATASASSAPSSAPSTVSTSVIGKAHACTPVTN